MNFANHEFSGYKHQWQLVTKVATACFGLNPHGFIPENLALNAFYTSKVSECLIESGPSAHGLNCSR